MSAKSRKKNITDNILFRKSICFVSETGRVERPLIDPSARYRCYHPAESLVQAGNNCTVLSSKHFFENPNFNHDIYVFHRPNIARQNFMLVIDFLRKQGATLIADYDDLIFGTPEIALISSAFKNGTMDEETAVQAFAINHAGLQQFDKVSVSTAPLAERVREFNPSAKVVIASNFLPNSIVSTHAELGTPYIKRPSTTIGYFAGTQSHNKDFPIVSEVLYRVLLENPRFKLLVVGPVHLPQGIASLPNVNTAPVVNFLRLPSLMSMCATVIAPLETSAFNECKSRVKFLEAALSGCRLIATPIPDMVAVGEDHITMAENADEWYEALSSVYDVDTRSEFAQFNLNKITAENHIDGLMELVS